MVFYNKMAVKNISESVYVGICHEVGTSQEVAFRREITDELFINQVFKHLVNIPNDDPSGIQIMDSGSHKKKFRLHGSDVDRLNVLA